MGDRKKERIVCEKSRKKEKYSTNLAILAMTTKAYV